MRGKTVSINDNIFKIMKDKGLTQKEFSRLSGIPESTISDWKNHGKIPGSDKLGLICRTLGVDLHSLFVDDMGVETDTDGVQPLSADERQLIFTYRSIPEYRKKAVLTYFEYLKDTPLSDSQEDIKKTANTVAKKEEIDVDIDFLQKKILARKLRKLARLDRIKLDENEHNQGLNLHLFKYLDYLGIEKLDYIKDYLSHIQPFMLTEIKSQEKFDNAICVLDGGYRIAIYIKVDATKGEEVIVSFHENHKNGVARATRQSKNTTSVYVFADGVGSHVVGTDNYTIDLFLTRGIKTIHIIVAAYRYDEDGFLVRLADIDREITNMANQYLEDIYTSDIDFSTIDKFSSMYQLSFTSFGQDNLSNISILIDSLLIQQTQMGRQIADAAICIYCNSISLLDCDKKELIDTLKERFAVNSSRFIPLIMERVEMNLLTVE